MKMMPQRNRGLRFLIDTNRINAYRRLPYMKQIERWNRDGVISLNLCDIVQNEIWKGKNIRRILKSIKYPISGTLANTDKEKDLLKKIEEIFSKAKLTESDKNDALILFNAKKYGFKLITNDGDSRSQPGGILGHAKQLREQFEISVLRDYEAVELVKKDLKKRDKLARWAHERYNEPLPVWVGND